MADGTAGIREAADTRAAQATVRVALLTPPARGALAVVGLAGEGACRLADERFRPRQGGPLVDRPDRGIAVGIWLAKADAAGEELIVVRHASDHLEVHCHGGTAAAQAVIESVLASGGVRQDWPLWLADGGSDPIEIEARQALALAAGPRAARILARQLSGMLAAELVRLSDPRSGLVSPADRQAAVARLVRASRVGLRLVDPWRVVVAGPVNAGKSSLVNALAGHARSIVSAEPGTTRDLVTTRLVFDGWEVDLIDTAGGRLDVAAASPTEQVGIARALEAAASADLILHVVLPGDPLPQPAPRELVVITKADLSTGQSQPTNAIVTSAFTGQGIDLLVARIVASLVPEDHTEPGLLDGPVPFTLRQVASIRGGISG